MRILAIDPGLKGAIAVWDGRELIVHDVPIMKARSRGNEVNIVALADLISRIGPPYLTAAYIERSGVRPEEGVSSAQKNGLTAGMLVGCASMVCKTIIRPTPQSWKKVVGLTKDKEYSRTKAIETFPTFHEYFSRKKDHDRAEAALLAYYGFNCEHNKASRSRKRLADVV